MPTGCQVTWVRGRFSEQFLRCKVLNIVASKTCNTKSPILLNGFPEPYLLPRGGVTGLHDSQARVLAVLITLLL